MYGTLIKEFIIGNKHCAVIGMSYEKQQDILFCNGYVEVYKNNTGKDYSKFRDQIESQELTFSNTLYHIKGMESFKGWYFGFDTNHLWNEENPYSKQKDYVIYETQRLAREMIYNKI